MLVQDDSLTVDDPAAVAGDREVVVIQRGGTLSDYERVKHHGRKFVAQNEEHAVTRPVAHAAQQIIQAALEQAGGQRAAFTDREDLRRGERPQCAVGRPGVAAARPWRGVAGRVVHLGVKPGRPALLDMLAGRLGREPVDERRHLGYPELELLALFLVLGCA